MFYAFKLGHDTAEVTKNICCANGKSAIDHYTVTRCLKKFHSGCKNLNNQARSGSPKPVDSETVLQAIEANPGSSIKVYQISLTYHCAVWFVPFTTLPKISGTASHYQNMTKFLTRPSINLSMTFINFYY